MRLTKEHYEKLELFKKLKEEMNEVYDYSFKGFNGEISVDSKKLYEIIYLEKEGYISNVVLLEEDE